MMTTKTIGRSLKIDNLAASRRMAGNKSGLASSKAENISAACKRQTSPDQDSGRAPTTKHAQLLRLLNRPEGASIEDLMRATNWQQHSVRGFLAGTVKKKMGLSLTSSRVEGEPRRYKIAARRGR